MCSCLADAEPRGTTWSCPYGRLLPRSHLRTKSKPSIVYFWSPLIHVSVTSKLSAKRGESQRKTNADRNGDLDTLTSRALTQTPRKSGNEGGDEDAGRRKRGITRMTRKTNRGDDGAMTIRMMSEKGGAARRPTTRKRQRGSAERPEIGARRPMRANGLRRGPKRVRRSPNSPRRLRRRF